MKHVYSLRLLVLSLLLSIGSFELQAQPTCEWRLANATYSGTDPDGAGPALGSITFTMQIHTTSGTITGVNDISTGWSFLSTDLMIPTTPGCSVVSNPANVSLSAGFIAGGFAFTTVNQCGAFSQTAGGKSFDTRSVGTLSGTSIDITTTWIDVYTVTMWTLTPAGGYVIINSSDGGTPGAFTSYAVADNLANEYTANSLTYNTPLQVGQFTLPILFTKFDATCGDNGTLVSWSTASEFNSGSFQLQSSTDGNNWNPVASLSAAGNSFAAHNYQLLDPNGGKALYRIKEIENDGSASYTDIISTNCSARPVGMVIYPVPARNLLNVLIKTDKPLTTQLMIIDETGRIMRKIQTSLVAGTNTFEFDLKGLASGQYLIRSNAPQLQLNKSFTILR